jgi:GxxExxY protein
MELLEKDLTEKVIGACIEVANELGAGFLESVYQKALVIVLTQLGLNVREQMPLQVKFRNHIVGDFFPDFLVEDKLIIEIKAVKCTSHELRLQVTTPNS